MQNSNKILEGSRLGNTIIRQYSTFLNNNPADAIIQSMTQSSKVPFNPFEYRFNSTSPKNAFGLHGFNKASDANSIIQKLMKTKQIQNNFELQNLLENSFVKNPVQTKRIQLNQTQAKIFREVINIIDQIQQLKEKLAHQTQQFTELKHQMKQVGIDFPQIPQSEETQINFNNKRLTQDQLNLIFDQNERLQAQIKKKTEQITNNKGSQLSLGFNKAKQQNIALKRKTQQLQNLIYSSGDIDQSQMNQLRINIQRLKAQVFRLDQNRLNKLSQTDTQIIHLKEQNQILRQKTIDILKNKNQNISSRKAQLISFLQSEELNRQKYMHQIQELKAYYDELMEENSQLTGSSKGFNQSLSYNTKKNYDSLHMESKVTPFNTQNGKQNFNNNYRKEFSYESKNYNDSSKGRNTSNQFQQYQNVLKRMRDELRK